jgi:hypothetical protein
MIFVQEHGHVTMMYRGVAHVACISLVRIQHVWYVPGAVQSVSQRI